MVYSKLQKILIFWRQIQRYLKMKYGKYLEYDLEKNDRFKHCFLLNSANVALLLSIISVINAKMGKWNKADRI